MPLFSFRGNRAEKPDPLIHSSLLPRAFDGFGAEDCLHVLDVGTGVSDTVQFLARYRSKIYFLDLAEALAGDAEPDAFTAALDDYAGVLFDVCLFWDLLHRLDAHQLRTLSEALVPFTYSATRVHSLCRFSATDNAVDYRIRGADQLEAVRSKPRSYQSWSYTDFGENFPGFSIAADLHAPDGRVEMLLVTT